MGHLHDDVFPSLFPGYVCISLGTELIGLYVGLCSIEVRTVILHMK